MPQGLVRLHVSALVVLVVASMGCRSESNDSSGANRAPTISGNPDHSVTVGELFFFQPTANDAEGDPLSFSVSNRPAWAAFEPSVGRLSGTPAAGAEGVYSDIRITVSDGPNSSSISFDIVVNAEGSDVGSIALSWTAPTQYEDGSLLTDLAGYKIYYGKSPGNYSREIHIDNPSVNSYLIENLSESTWYIVATSLNSAGVESDYTGEISAVAHP